MNVLKDICSVCIYSVSMFRDQYSATGQCRITQVTDSLHDDCISFDTLSQSEQPTNLSAEFALSYLYIFVSFTSSFVTFKNANDRNETDVLGWS